MLSMYVALNNLIPQQRWDVQAGRRVTSADRQASGRPEGNTRQQAKWKGEGDVEM